ncbi:23S rRNA (adenine(2030)-N(6))-methyltransferase RlmJ [Tepidimonas charontis]|uniref:Ribosomal RNA large subunit methyltransferase J n=1 Tax=Tepidimonas charontis TaxID=2267262 RepID=A0A554XEV5_9BURK|nr:23S rRNA (adenine(2030)-N(6))-methyltransferase RlmJ [Tepidimonas charontis]TSE34370.1 Ribosomal RNA large subunit methyltransferase J [Tepidimonas charontis]
MFSYRHAFHAGNHADVLKHLTLLGAVQRLHAKPGGVLLVDTHAGAGLYRLDQAEAQTSGEAAGGVLALAQALARADRAAVPALIEAYRQRLDALNDGGAWRLYPGSPAWLQGLLRPQDRLVLFELHPTDGRLLDRTVRAWQQHTPRASIELRRDDGFVGLKALLPPPQRRALVLIDPSYELKSDYAAVAAAVDDALRRFAPGCLLVWYPVIGRPEAHALPRRLRALAERAGRPWLRAELHVGAPPDPQARAAAARGQAHGALRASGMFVINPPYTLAEQLHTALTWLLPALRRGPGAQVRVDRAAGGG